mgnify:CR=1 FL=1
MRGEYYHLKLYRLYCMGSPLLARGVHYYTSATQSFFGITPACAGSTYKLHSFCPYFRDHPCLRGEYERRWINGTFRKGSPLLARGVPLQPLILYLKGLDHPCLRGEYAITSKVRGYYLGSPLLARGVLGVRAHFIEFVRITPACAGSTR